MCGKDAAGSGCPETANTFPQPGLLTCAALPGNLLSHGLTERKTSRQDRFATQKQSCQHCADNGPRVGPRVGDFIDHKLLEPVHKYWQAGNNEQSEKIGK